MSTECPEREDKTHCECWQDGGICCACGAPGMSREQKVEQGMVEPDKQAANKRIQVKKGDWAKYYQLVPEGKEFNLKMCLVRIEKVCPVMVRISFLTSLTDALFYLTIGNLGKTKLVKPTELTVIK